MARNLIIPRFYPKQIEFLEAKARYIAFGGARGGGKSFIMRWKVILLALSQPGIQILLLRRSLSELRENHLIPLQKMLRTQDKDPNNKIAQYKEVTKEFLFDNGSRIKLGYCDSENDVLQFQGQAYEVICLEEATHFTEFQFQSLTESNRPSGLMAKPFPPRMYFTCNPGGVGHAYIKRLFVDRKYKGRENPDDYVFIRSSVYDNKWLLDNDPEYVRTLENLPEKRRLMMLDGSWDVYENMFFDDFDPDIQVIYPRKLPNNYRLYRTLDYGLDMLACYHIIVDNHNNIDVIHEIYEPNVIVTDAVELIKQATKDLGFTERDVDLTLAPDDLWSRNAQTGKSTADLFYSKGITLTKVNRDRINGWIWMKDTMRIDRVKTPEGVIKTTKFKIFNVCSNLIRCIPLAQYDEKKGDDMSITPHEITHSLDAIRYFCTYWVTAPRDIEHIRCKNKMKWTEDMIEDYYNGSDYVKRRMVSLYGEIT